MLLLSSLITYILLGIHTLLANCVFIMPVTLLFWLDQILPWIVT